MKQMLQKKFSQIQVGASVTVSVSSLDKGKEGARNVLGGYYKKCTKQDNK